MRRGSVALVVVLLVGLGPLEVTASSLDAGVVTVETQATGDDHECPVEGSLAACPFSWDTNSTTEPGDDTLSFIVFVNEVHVGIESDTGLVPSYEVTFVPTAIVLQHPLYRKVNETWPLLNDTRPTELQPVVGFERGASERGEPGVFVDLYPVGLRAGWCWDICFIHNQTYGEFNETEIRPFPYGIVLREYTGETSSTDFIIERKMYEVSSCGAGTLDDFPVACETSAIKPALRVAQDEYEATTPLLRSEFQVNRTTVALDSESTPDARLPAGDSTFLRLRAGRELSFERSPTSPWGISPTRGMGPTLPLGPPQAQGHPAGRAEGGAPRTTVQGTASPTPPLLVVMASVTAVMVALVAWLLYHRVGRANGLEQETRRRIYEMLVASPGLRRAELAGRLSLGHNTVKYHLDCLEKWRMVRAGSGARPRYFPVDRSEAEARVVEALAQPSVRDVLAAVHTMENATLSRIAAAVGLSVATVHRAVERLEAAGLASKTRVGFRVFVRPTGSVVEQGLAPQAALG